MATYQANLPASRPFQGMPIPSGPAAPAGTFLPGTKVQVGSHRVVIDRYLSEGGFAHVYVVTLPKPVDGINKAVLKRVAVPDKDHLANMRNEVETMKRLRGHKQIVKYIDSHASSLKNGGYEVFLLMEWCNGGGLIDFMNTRLQNRLTEPEIVKIFTDVAEGVACMHYLKPALMHRDLKVENILISVDGKSKTFKLCDFGSAAVARPAATTAAEGRLIEDDIQRHTTLQYRSPEMIDVYRKQPIDEKSDIWALGCFLYKLCYYTTPFEEVGQMAILNARFKYPGYPRFSDELKLLIASMLQEDPAKRPNIYSVLAKATKMDGRPLSLRDIYTNRSQSEDSRPQSQPQTERSQPKSGATLAPVKQEPVQAIPQVEPMRRGRPVKTMSHHNSAKPSPSPLRMIDHSDAFAGLDGGAGADELSSKFPKLEEFSLLSDTSSKFPFQPAQQKPAASGHDDLAQRVTQALADDAFNRPASPPKPKALAAPKVEDSRQANLQRQRSLEAKDVLSGKVTSLPQKSRMVSTAVGSSPPPLVAPKIAVSDRPVWKVPDATETPERSASITQASNKTKPIISKDRGGSRLAHLLQHDADRSQSAHESREHEPRSPTSSRPSLEGGRPLLRELDSGVQRSKSLNVRNRPVSVNVSSQRATHINDQEIKKPVETRGWESQAEMAPLSHAVSETNTNIKSDLAFLRAREEEEREKHKHMKRLSGSSRHHQKRSSLPSIAAGTKNLFQGRFSEAFRKFEGGQGEPTHDNDVLHSPTGNEQHMLTPIAGSEATDLSDDRRGLEETEELSPELRRELEKQKLEAEERRVEAAAQEYRNRLANRGTGPPPVSTKAASIQGRVKSLLEKDRPATKTATGYGRFTTEESQSGAAQISRDVPTTVSRTGPTQYNMKPISAPASAINLQAQNTRLPPTKPQKPQGLRTATGTNDMIPSPNDADDLDSFQKKFPDLSQLEVVETSIESPRPRRMREV
ncbi:Ark- serine/threonine protein kinase [Knufia fluminis]|uniref:non-specific serine/threonine protein kinase n=1 Tax=Knufia fluminis TaxID=191047 RepID=A0AAN8E8T7_9EURO|nr:Ark- serine/threonine protein kinase [Knufia fluminis]